MLTNAGVNPICGACFTQIGTMPLDIYLDAIKRRGEVLLCPECRKNLCNSCGFFVPGRVNTTYLDEDGRVMGKACDSCEEFVLPELPGWEDFPHQKLNAIPNSDTKKMKTISTYGIMGGNNGE